MKHWKLCYIDKQTAYFTTQQLSNQQGDDWDDVPYEHNAGAPYTAAIRYYMNGGSEKIASDWNDDATPKWEICQVKFELDYCYATPAQQAGTNSIYSVEMINRGDVPWITGGSWPKKHLVVWAGTSMENFKHMVQRAGGKIFVEEHVDYMER